MRGGGWWVQDTVSSRNEGVAGRVFWQQVQVLCRFPSRWVDFRYIFHINSCWKTRIYLLTIWFSPIFRLIVRRPGGLWQWIGTLQRWVPRLGRRSARKMWTILQVLWSQDWRWGPICRKTIKQTNSDIWYLLYVSNIAACKTLQTTFN